jgi:hypothetical protein
LDIAGRHEEVVRHRSVDGAHHQEVLMKADAVRVEHPDRHAEQVRKRPRKSERP